MLLAAESWLVSPLCYSAVRRLTGRQRCTDPVRRTRLQLVAASHAQNSSSTSLSINANDPAFIRYYHDDVVLELGSTTIQTPAGIRDFCAPVKAHIHEKVELAHFVADATGIAAELPTESRVYKDWESGFFQRPLKAGEVMRTISFVLYEVQDRMFRHIRAARYKQIHDWRTEPA